MLPEKGNKIKIGSKEFDVIDELEEFDKVNQETMELMGEHTVLYLHEIGNNLLHPTHVIKKYYSGRSS